MGGLGHHFGGSGASFWNHFGGLGGFWLPNAILGRLGGRLGGQHGPNLASKTEPKSINIDTKIDQFLDASWDRFVSEFGGYREPTWTQVSTNIHQKLCQDALRFRCHFVIFSSMFNGSFIILPPIFEPRKPTKR